MTVGIVESALHAFADTTKAANLRWFFKTGPGQYGEGDEFAGITMPEIRMVAKRFKALPLEEVQRLLDSPIHEYRMCALVILDLQYSHATGAEREYIYNTYLLNLHNGRINNWDLVDVTCRGIVGAHLWQRPRDVLFELAQSVNLWERRTAIISTFYFIGKGDASTSMELAEMLLHDTHDLMHKAVGWTLREVGKRVDRKLLTDFLDVHAHEMPRTALRYAIEHLSPEQKAHYMGLKAQSL